ncbi:hypothetical protein EDD15DRAFT_1183566 [Pisolithus albus]|nr:hypothetical protein EDD15DRAFT_1183566 [Pisolithus albus]
MPVNTFVFITCLSAQYVSLAAIVWSDGTSDLRTKGMPFLFLPQSILLRRHTSRHRMEHPGPYGKSGMDRKWTSCMVALSSVVLAVSPRRD